MQVAFNFCRRLLSIVHFYAQLTEFSYTPLLLLPNPVSCKSQEHLFVPKHSYKASRTQPYLWQNSANPRAEWPGLRPQSSVNRRTTYIHTHCVCTAYAFTTISRFSYLELRSRSKFDYLATNYMAFLLHFP